MGLLYQALLVIVFAAGSAMLWLSLLGQVRIGRASRLAHMLERVKKLDRISFLHEKHAEERGPKERAYREKARLVGLPAEWGYARYRLLQLAVSLTLLSMSVVDMPAAGISFVWLMRPLAAGLTGWWMPMAYLWAAAAHRRSGYLMEIAKLSHRLSVCVSDKADIREMLIRAGRPLQLLKPHLQELIVMWGKDQRAAIWRFKEAVGISEVYPLVNALEAISQADAKAVAKVLKEQTASIEATLSSEINRKIENAPIWISFYIMIPFGMIIVLFLYPWIVTISGQLLTSFQGS